MLKVIELFAGIGSQTKALKNKNIAHEVVAIAEIDKYAIASYEAIHGKVSNLGDITNIEILPDCDLLTYSFPCQDLSIAGKGAGIKKGTRSGLLFEVERLLLVAKENNALPSYLLLENVKNLVGKNHKQDFDNWLIFLESLGYSNFWQVLNAKNYGIPQNRERVFVISTLKHLNYEFPKPKELQLFLKDFLEDEVDEKYYLSDKIITFFRENSIKQKEKGNGFRFSPKDGSGIAKAITTRSGSRMDDNFLEIPEATKKGYKEAYVGDSVNLAFPGSKTRRGRVGDKVAQTLTCNDTMGAVVCEQRSDEGLRFFKDNMCGSLRTTNSCGDKRILTENPLRIRKLTPLECWRLMGFSDTDFLKARSVGISNAQLYKQAGNSIVVNVLESIFEELFLKEYK